MGRASLARSTSVRPRGSNSEARSPPGASPSPSYPSKEIVPASRRAAKLATVDASTGAVSPLGDGLVPANRFGLVDSIPLMTPAEAGAPWSSLFLDADGRLVRLDPATGAKTVLLGKGK